jgi:hypothetical protein
MEIENFDIILEKAQAAIPELFDKAYQERTYFVEF